MLKRKKYTGFTLVEMLIVMGILSILMAIGVSVARFAIQRANNIQHQSAADQMFQALQSHYTDKRHYPTIADFGDFDIALNDPAGVLDKYVDASFDGGAPARFWYIINGSETYPQAFLVCVSYSDPSISLDATQTQGGYCNGNGFGVVPTDGATITKKVYEDDAFTTVMSANGVTAAATINSVSDDWGDGKWD